MKMIEAKEVVHQVHPKARECYEAKGWPRRKINMKEVVIGVGLNTVVGRGKTVYAAWLNAAKNVLEYQ